MSALAGILTIILLFINLGVSNLFADSLEKTFPAARAVELHAEGASIELIGEGTDRIALEAECRKSFSEYYELSSEMENGVLRIDIRRKDNDSGLFGLSNIFRNSPGLKLSLNVPFETTCTLNTSGGNIEACSLNANLAAHTSGGSIQCNNVRGVVELQTSGGRVSCERISGDLQAKTSGGSIKLDKCDGATVLKTSGGGIYVDSHTGCLDARTSGGSVSATFDQRPSNDCTLETSGGGITLALPAGSNANLYARTSGGRVISELPVTSTFTGNQDRNELEGRIGGGGPQLTLKTSGGGIRIKSNGSDNNS